MFDFLSIVAIVAVYATVILVEQLRYYVTKRVAVVEWNVKLYGQFVASPVCSVTAGNRWCLRKAEEYLRSNRMWINEIIGTLLNRPIFMPLMFPLEHKAELVDKAQDTKDMILEVLRAKQVNTMHSNDCFIVAGKNIPALTRRAVSLISLSACPVKKAIMRLFKTEMEGNAPCVK